MQAHFLTLVSQGVKVLAAAAKSSLHLTANIHLLSVLFLLVNTS